MNIFLLDLWHDLREKRLAPVAVVLAVALVAVPLVLRKKPEAPPAAPTAATSPAEGAQKTLAVKALQEAKLPSSDLGVFDPKDPFKPMSRPEPDASDGKAKLPASTGSSSGSDTGSAGATSSGSSAGSTSGGGDKSSGGSGGESSPAPAPRLAPKQKLYTYVVDLKFGKSGAERSRKGVKRLTILPNDDNPLLVFLGVKTDGKRAIFLVDSSLSPAGEGKCSPERDTCTFLELQDVKEKNQHSFTDEAGQKWTLTLVDIRRVEVKDAKKSKKSSARREARSKQRSSGPSNVFETLLFADETR
jgi:hypothetical protein